MRNGENRVNYFKNQEKKKFSKKSSEFAPIILFQIEKSKDFKRIYICEGESDAMALAVHCDFIIIMPGANSYTSIVRNNTSLLVYLLLHIYEFCILFDNDLPRQKGAKDLKQTLVEVFTSSSVATFDWLDRKAKDLHDSLASVI